MNGQHGRETALGRKQEADKRWEVNYLLSTITKTAKATSYSPCLYTVCLKGSLFDPVESFMTTLFKAT